MAGVGHYCLPISDPNRDHRGGEDDFAFKSLSLSGAEVQWEESNHDHRSHSGRKGQ